MSGRRSVAVVVVTGPGSTVPDPALAGRSTTGWLLDGLEQLDATMLTATGPAADRIADEAGRHAGMADRWTARLPDPADMPVLLVSSTSPLISVDTLTRAADAAAGTSGGCHAVLLRPRPSPPWWEPVPAPAAAGLAGLAVAGASRLSTGELAALFDGAPGGGDADHRLTDAGATLAEMSMHPVESLRTSDPVELAEARRVVNARIVAGWLRRGVHVEDPATTYIEATVELAPGVVLLPGTHLAGATSVGAGTRVGPAVSLRDCRIGAHGQLRYAVCQDVDLGDRVNVGPYAWLRSGARLDEDCRAGAFVEIADSTVGAGSSVPHLAGLFSADVGRDCNLASMSGPANFNGGVKNRVRIGDGVSIGAGTILVAPVEVGDGAETAAGSVITDDVPSGALGMGRTAQRNVAGWADLRRAVRDAEH